MPILFVSMRRTQDDDLFATLVGELETMGFTNYLEAAPPAEGAARADFLKGAPCAIVSEQSLHLVDLELYADGVVAMDAEPQVAATQCSAQCTVHSAQCIVQCIGQLAVQCTVHCVVPCVVHCVEIAGRARWSMPRALPLTQSQPHP